MEHNQSESENVSSVWERLRQKMAEFAAESARRGDPQAHAEKLARRARQLRRQAAAPGRAGESIDVLALSQGRAKYGIALEHVVEIQALEQFSPVPQAPAYIRGVVQWRGAILALLDLMRLFEAVESGLSDLHAYVVVEAAGKRLALAASEVQDVVTIPREALKPPPELPAKIAAEWVAGIHEDVRLILKIDEIFKFLEQGGRR